MTIKRWDQFTTTIKFSNADWTATDITGCSVFFIVRTTNKPQSINDDDDTVKIKKDITVHSDAENWETELKLLKEDTNITPWQYFYEIQIVFPNDDILSCETWVFQVLYDLNKRIWVE